MPRSSSERPPRPPRPPSRYTGFLLISFLVLGALAGAFVGLQDVNGESTGAKPIHCGQSALSILVSGSDSIVQTGAGARGKFAQHICWRDAQRTSAFAGALMIAPFVIVLLYARGRNRSDERL